MGAQLMSGSPVPAPMHAGRVEPERARELAWIRDIRAGAPDAFEAMFRSYVPELCTFVAAYVRSRHVAEELVQDLFLKIWRQREHWEVETNLRTYLYAAARHAALNHLRRERTERHWREDAVHSIRHSPGLAPTAETADNEVASRELAAAVEMAVERLPERCREVYRLSRVHHLTYAEIAAVLGIAPKTVENHIGLALKAIRRRLGHLLD